MPGPRDKKPSDPELEFGEPEVPTGKFAPLSPGGQAARVVSVKNSPRVTPVTLPAPGEAKPVHGAGPPPRGRRANSVDQIIRTGSTNDFAANDEKATSPPPGRQSPRDARAGVSSDDLFGELTRDRPNRAPAQEDSDRPTRAAPATPGTPLDRQPVAPRPPRMPTMGPEPEFSFGIEGDGFRERQPSVPPVAAPRITARPSDADDLSWDPAPAASGDHSALQDSELPSLPFSDAGDAHELAARASCPPAAFVPPDSRRELDDRYALGDFSGALVIAEAMASDPGAGEEVARIADECRDKLRQMYASRLGSFDQVPAMAVPRSELKWLSLDHRAGFVLSLVDGVSSMEEIIDLSGMAALEVLRTLYDLVNQRVIEFKPAPRR